jgi:hypothetical protein
MKVDDEREVSELFQRSVKLGQTRVDISVKKFVFKLLGQLRERTQSGSMTVADLWRFYFKLGDNE